HGVRPYGQCANSVLRLAITGLTMFPSMHCPVHRQKTVPYERFDWILTRLQMNFSGFLKNRARQFGVSAIDACLPSGAEPRMAKLDRQYARRVAPSSPTSETKLVDHVLDQRTCSATRSR